MINDIHDADATAIDLYREEHPGHADDCAVRLGAVNGIRWVRCLTHRSQWEPADR